MVAFLFIPLLRLSHIFFKESFIFTILGPFLMWSFGKNCTTPF